MDNVNKNPEDFIIDFLTEKDHGRLGPLILENFGDKSKMEGKADKAYSLYQRAITKLSPVDSHYKILNQKIDSLDYKPKIMLKAKSEEDIAIAEREGNFYFAARQAINLAKSAKEQGNVKEANVLYDRAILNYEKDGMFYFASLTAYEKGDKERENMYDALSKLLGDVMRPPDKEDRFKDIGPHIF